MDIMKKILHIFKTYYPSSQGGIEEVIKNISASVAGEHRVLTISTGGLVPLVYEYKGIEVYSLPMFFDFASTPVPLPVVSSIKMMKAQIEWCDIIHMHYPWPIADLICLFSSRRKKIVVTYHSDIIKQRFIDKLYSPLRNIFFKRVDTIVATSPNYARSSKVLARFMRKVDVIPLSIESDFASVVPVDSVSPEVVEAASETYFLFLGVHRYYKGLEYLVRSARHVNARIIVAGSGPETKSLIKMVAGFDLDNVVFVGRVSDTDKKYLLSGCLAFVLPSHLRSEAFGVCLLEAMAYSKPMITCEINSGMSFVNIDGQTGIAVKAESPDALAKAMNFMVYNTAKAEEMGRAAHCRFQSHFINSVTADSYNKLYKG